MPRKKINRRLLAPPLIKGLMILGPKNRTEQIFLHFEEFEAIKLLDYNNLTQEEAAACMDVSRPTLTRIYESARDKVARCLVEGKDMMIKGGKFGFDDNWQYCETCQSRFTLYSKSNQVCPVCSSKEIIPLNDFYKE